MTQKNMIGFVGDNTTLKNVQGPQSSKIFHNARVSDTTLEEYASIGDFSTVKESYLSERCMIQRHNDIWRLNAGKYTYVGRMTIVRSTNIGNFCALADFLAIGCDNHDYKMISTHPFWHDPLWGVATDNQFEELYHESEYEEPCEIGNDVWMGSGVNICRGVQIGNGCVIGAGAVITKSIEPYSVVVGVPGKVIKKRFDEKTIERLQRTNWWDLPTEVLKDKIHIFRDGSLNEERLEMLEKICGLYGLLKV